MPTSSRQTLEELFRDRPKSVDLPAPTAWPLVAAFGATLLFSGLLTHVYLSLAGAFALAAGLAGWFREVLPHERHETVPVDPIPEFPISIREKVARLDLGQVRHRARLPVEIHPVSAGLKGGLAGSVAMAVTAVLYGVLRHGSVWYPINLLAAGASAELARLSPEALKAFSGTGLLLATVIHGLISILVGLLYGVMLPMLPRRPILLGGLVAPLLWTGLLRTMLDLVNPTLSQHIDWSWFVASQIAFGVVAGLIVTRSQKIRTMQFAPFAVRAGFEATGLPPRGDREEPRP